jgi:hypothetical protein
MTASGLMGGAVLVICPRVGGSGPENRETGFSGASARPVCIVMPCGRSKGIRMHQGRHSVCTYVPSHCLSFLVTFKGKG